MDPNTLSNAWGVMLAYMPGIVGVFFLLFVLAVMYLGSISYTLKEISKHLKETSKNLEDPNRKSL